MTCVSNCMLLEQVGCDVRARILRETHLTVGMGIAHTKTLAKLANYAAKTWKKTGGMVDLDRQLKRLSMIKVGDV